MGDLEKEIVGSDKSIDEISVDELTVKTAKAAKKSKKSGKTGFFSSIKSEFKKIIWPDKTTVRKETTAVVTVSVLLGLLIALLDIVLRYGVDFLISLQER